MAVVFIINGDVNVFFYKEFVNQGMLVEDIFVVVFLVGEEEFFGFDIKFLVGYLVVWNYFMSVDMEENDVFIEKWYGFIKDKKWVINDLMEVMYIGFNLWVKVVEKVKIIDVDKVCDVIYGLKVLNLIGGSVEMLLNYYIIKLVLIGEIQDDGQFEVVWEIEKEVLGDVWIDFLVESVKIEVDWKDLKIMCGNYNMDIKKCLGQNY